MSVTDQDIANAVSQVARGSEAENHIYESASEVEKLACSTAQCDTRQIMLLAKRWLVWDINKVPYYPDGTPRRGKLDTPEDLQRLGFYHEALDAHNRNTRKFKGIGFALGPDGNGGFWQGVDFDKISANKLEDLFATLPGYVERSPSGLGAHAIGYGAKFTSLASNGTGIEAYAEKRYFTFTGDVLADRPYQCISQYVTSTLAPRHKKLPLFQTEYSAFNVTSKTLDELRSALVAIPADDYSVWVQVGHALKELGEIGKSMWIDWSAKSHKFSKHEAEKKWFGFNPVNTGYQAVFSEAQRRGWLNPRSNEAKGLAKAGNGRALIIRALDQVQMRSIDWLWTGWIPRGYITIWAGESGAGKSTVLADVAARVSHGARLPGEVEARPEPARVLWLGSEDGVEELTVPRLRACGANLSNIEEIQGVTIAGERNAFSMQDDLNVVRMKLHEAISVSRPYKLLIVDPITSYLSGNKLKKVDLNDAGQLRTVLEPWLAVAQEYKLAIVAVTHFMKDTTRAMLHRVLGSAAFAQTCRSLCAVVDRPDSEMYSKALLQVKVNLPEHPGGAWTFKTKKVSVGVDPGNGRSITATMPDWEELDSGITPENLMGGTRGPVSKYHLEFSQWVREYFKNFNEDYRRVEEVKSDALEAGVASNRWWREHSNTYLVKENIGGTWMCKPKFQLKLTV